MSAPHRPETARLGRRCCRFCDCSEFDACIDADGGPCYWLEADRCSACAGRRGPGWQSVVTAVCLTLLGLMIIAAAILGGK